MERKMLSGFVASLYLLGGLGLVAFKAPMSLAEGYGSFTFAIVTLAAAVMGTHAFERVSLSKNGFHVIDDMVKPIEDADKAEKKDA